MNDLITVNHLYIIAGIFLAVFAGKIFLDKQNPRRFVSGLFWLLLAFIFLCGNLLPSDVIGYLVIVLVILTIWGNRHSTKEKGTPSQPKSSAGSLLQNKIFIPALLIPIITIVGTFTFGYIKFGKISLIDSTQPALISLGIALIIALITSIGITRSRIISVPIQEGSRLLQTIGWTLILPQMLATLGGIFSQASIGPMISYYVTRFLPTQYDFISILAYCIGMMVLTMIMGNAFAAFAIMTGGIGIPLIVQLHGGNPSIMAPLGMFAGYCGALITPMAANVNITPAILLNLKDKNAVIKAQLPIALPLFVLNALFMYLLVFWIK